MALFTILSKVSACWSVKELNVDASQQRLSRFTRQTIIFRTIAKSVFMNVLAWIPYMEINQGTIEFWRFCAIFRSKSLDNGSCHQKNKAHQIWCSYTFAHAKIGGKIYLSLVDNDKPFLLFRRLLVVFLLFVVFLLVFLSILFDACKGSCFFLRKLFFVCFQFCQFFFNCSDFSILFFIDSLAAVVAVSPSELSSPSWSDSPSSSPCVHFLRPFA